MPQIFPSRAFFSTFAGTAVLLLAPPARAQTLPPATPTVAAVPSPQPAQTSALQPAARAQVQFANGLVTIRADNSSLNQILREISRLTGMTITGGVNDERVFGIYGPADTGAVLTTLLNGTGSNMVLVESSTNSPRQLVLTPRQGGPTPPSPSSYESPREQLPPPPPPLQPVIIQQPQQQQPQPGQMDGQNPPMRPQLQNQIQNQSQPDSSTTTQQSPNGVKTPQQIYEELMKLQQQNAPPPHQEP